MSELDLKYKAPKVVGQFMRSEAEFKAILGPFGCTSADTEFLTPTGWKRIDQYKEGDLVAQWYEDGRLEFVRPIRYVVQPCEDLLWFHNDSLSMQLSDEHRVPLYDWAGNFRVKTAARLAEKPSRHILPTTFTPPHEDAAVSDALLRLAVAINADGHYVPNGRQTIICVRKERKKVRIRELLNAARVPFRERSYPSRPTEVSFVFYPPYWGKTYTDWYWWSLSQRQLRIVIEEMSHWDGLFEGPETRYHSNHECDVNFMQYAAHAIGGKATIGVQDTGKKGWKPTYYVHIAMPGSPKAVATLRGDSVMIDRIPTEDGKKYCFTVPTGFFLARHNYSVFVTGNSGKSVGCCIEILRRCMQQRKGRDGFRRSRWVVVRNVRQQLKDTTIKTWMDWVKPGVFGYWKETELTFYMKFNDVRAEILFRALDTPEDVQKVLSLEATAVWLNEAQYIPREILEGLQGRIKRYPSKDMGGSNYWGIIADTNPPAVDTYWYKIFENLPTEEGNEDSVVDCDTFKQPSGLAPDADNIENLEPGYYEALAKGKSKVYVDTVVHAKYPPSQVGKPVYHSSFKRERHVSDTPLAIDPTLPVIVGQDWGLTPAGLWMQMQHDGRIFILRETVAFDMGTKRYMQKHFRPMHKTTFPLNPVVVIGDPAGVRRSDSDESTCFQMFKKSGYMAKPASTNDPDVRIKTFHDLFSTYPDGEPMVLIDPSCKWFIQAVQSKYHYPKKKQSISEEYADKPAKNDWGHVVEAGQYGALFLTGRKYDPTDYAITHLEDPMQFNAPAYKPAQREGY